MIQGAPVATGLVSVSQQGPKFLCRQSCLSQHFVEQPPGDVAFVLVADTDAQDGTVRQDSSPGLVFLGSELLEASPFQNLTEVVIRERSHA